jgi:hypothetical protein
MISAMLWKLLTERHDGARPPLQKARRQLSHNGCRGRTPAPNTAPIHQTGLAQNRRIRRPIASYPAWPLRDPHVTNRIQVKASGHREVELKIAETFAGRRLARMEGDRRSSSTALIAGISAFGLQGKLTALNAKPPLAGRIGSS